MNRPKNVATELDRWKDKYFALQESYDVDVNDAQEFRSILQRLLLRICLSAEGQSRVFDQELEVLRQQIKSKDLSLDALSGQLNEIDRALSEFDETKANNLKQFVLVFDQLVTQLLALKPPRSQRSALKKLNKSISPKNLTSGRFVPLLEEYAALQGTILETQDKEEPSQVGLLDRLFGSDKPQQKESVAIENLDDALDIDARQDEEDEVIPGFSAISAHIAATMNNLLDQLTFPESSQRALDDLRTRIAQKLNWYELGPTLDDLSSVVLSAVGRGQREFGQFLIDIDERLQKIQNFVLETIQADDGLRNEEQMLDQQMRSQIATMATSLDETDDVETLKTSIRTQVENITAVLDRFSETGRQIEENKAKELEAMRLRFQALEEETRFFRKRLKEERSKALTDALTQLPNREAYDDRVSLEYERWKRYRKPATLVIADVDHFKAINDNYGHLSGDKVLQILAKEMQARIRQTDFVARYGGEEFVLILPETELDVAKGVIEKMRDTISRLPFHFRDEKLQVTISFGLVEFAEGKDTNVLFDCADQALYKAKEAGRNCFRVWQD